MVATGEMLKNRLNQLGLESDLIPAFINFASTICSRDPNITVADFNNKLAYLGWMNIELDYRTHELLMAYIENEISPTKKKVSYYRLEE